MDVGLAVAGLICVGMAFGHAAIGLLWVLPGLEDEHLPSTPFGPRSLTEGMVRVTWHVVTIFVLSLGSLLMAMAWPADVDPKTLLLRVFAAGWVAATAMALWVSRGRLRHAARLPVPLLWVAVAVLLWVEST